MQEKIKKPTLIRGLSTALSNKHKRPATFVFDCMGVHPDQAPTLQWFDTFVNSELTAGNTSFMDWYFRDFNATFPSKRIAFPVDSDSMDVRVFMMLLRSFFHTDDSVLNGKQLVLKLSNIIRPEVSFRMLLKDPAVLVCFYLDTVKVMDGPVLKDLPFSPMEVRYGVIKSGMPSRRNTFRLQVDSATFLDETGLALPTPDFVHKKLMAFLLADSL